MRLRTTERRPDDAPLGAVFALPLLGLPLGAWLLSNGYIHFGTCGLKQLAGIPCMMCGATTATLTLLDGAVLTAISLQPMVILGYFALALWGIVSLGALLAGRSLDLRLTSAETTGIKIAIVAIPLLNWGYLIAIGA